MKLETKLRHHRNRSTGILLFDMTFVAMILAGVMAMTGCGGTITIRPDGSLSYTSPEILKPKIVEPAK